MDRLIIRGEPFEVFQHIYVYKDGEKVDSIGVQFDELVDITFALLQKYRLNKIDLSGVRTFTEEIQHKIQQAITTYDVTNLEFRYV